MSVPSGAPPVGESPGSPGSPMAPSPRGVFGRSPAPGSAVFPNLRQTVLLVAVFLGGAALAAVAFHPLGGLVSRQLWLFLVVLVGEGLGVLCALRMARWPLRRAFAHLDFSTATLGWLLLIGIGNLLLAGSLLYTLTHLFGAPDQEFLLELFEVRGPTEFLLLFATVAVTAPLFEEVLVRGILLRGLTLSRGVRGGVLWSAFFFAVIHLNPLQAGPAFVNGVVWALVLLRTGSLGTTFFLHALNNSLVFLLVQLTLAAPPGTDPAAAMQLSDPVRWAMVAVVGLAGLRLVVGAVQRLPMAPERLARFWGLPQPDAVGV